MATNDPTTTTTTATTPTTYAPGDAPDVVAPTSAAEEQRLAESGALMRERMKTCPRCHRLRPLSAFPPNPHSRDGHFNLCRECLSANMSRTHAQRRALAEAQARQPIDEYARATIGEQSVRLHLGYGVIPQGTSQGTTPAVQPATPPAPVSPPTSPFAALDAVAGMGLQEWLTNPACSARGEAFLIPTSAEAEGALLAWRSGSTVYLLSGDAERWPTPERPIDPEVLLYIVRLKCGQPATDGDVIGVRFA